MRVVELTLPRAVAANETVDLAVRAGFVARGAQIDVAMPSGELIGTISPFAIRGHRPAGTYTFPLKPSAIHDGRVTVTLSVRVAGMPARPPTPEEVTDVRVVFTRTSP